MMHRRSGTTLPWIQWWPGHELYPVDTLMPEQTENILARREAIGVCLERQREI